MQKFYHVEAISREVEALKSILTMNLRKEKAVTCVASKLCASASKTRSTKEILIQLRLKETKQEVGCSQGVIIVLKWWYTALAKTPYP